VSDDVDFDSEEFEDEAGEEDAESDLVELVPGVVSDFAGEPFSDGVEEEPPLA
jgi:hypothetical protein